MLNGWYGLLWSLRLKMASGFSRISRAFSVFLKPIVNCYRVEYFISFQLAMTSLSSVTSVLARIRYKPIRDVKRSLALHSGINFAKALFCQIMKVHQWAVGSLSGLFRYEASFRWEKGLGRHLSWGTNFFGERKNLNFLPTSFSRCSLLAVENLFLLFCCSADLRTIRNVS